MSKYIYKRQDFSKFCQTEESKELERKMAREMGDKLRQAIEEARRRGATDEEIQDALNLCQCAMFYGQSPW